MKTNNYHVADPSPEAWISTHKNRQRIYKEKNVYLSDKQEFEIELLNKTSSVYMAKVSINGVPISNRGIILKPGQRVFLERFIDENRKLVFQTYEVDGSEETKKAIARNGDIEVSFFKEIENSSGITYTTCSYNSNSGTGTVPYNTFTYNASNTTITPASLYSSNSVDLSGSISATGTFTTSSAFVANEKTMETGRIQRGEKSDQNFENGYGNFNVWSTHTYKYKILPISQLPIEPKELRSYCYSCGTRIKKSSWKFCPSCGAKME